MGCPWKRSKITRYAAGVENYGAVLEALFLVTLHETGNPAHSSRRNHRPQWVHCTGDVASGRNDDWMPNRR